MFDLVAGFFKSIGLLAGLTCFWIGYEVQHILPIVIGVVVWMLFSAE